MPQKIPLGRRIAYALGASGFQISDRMVVAIGIYYYLPPGDVDLVPQVSTEIFFGVLTAYGLARLLGGVFDSLADPLVGYGSDRSHSRLGRRRVYMIAGIAPMVVAPVLLFWPPGEPGTTANFVWLALLLCVYYVFFTVYVAPYLALIPEIAWTQEDRVALSILLALVGFPVLGLYGAGWLWGVDVGRELGLSREAALRVVVLVSAALAFVLCLLPILAVDERRYTRSSPSTLSLRQALGATIGNRPFRIYLAAQIPFILGVNMLLPAMPYISIVLLGRDEGFAALLGLLGALPTVAGFFAVNALTPRIGPRNTVVACIVCLGLLLGALGFVVPDGPGGPHDLRNLWIVCGAMTLAGLPVAGFLVLPNVIIGQLVDLDEKRTGANRSAMYFGAQGLFTKWVYAVSAVLLSYLFAAFGNSREEPLGVLLVGPVGCLCCLISAALYARYPEHEVIARGIAEETASAGEP